MNWTGGNRLGGSYGRDGLEVDMGLVVDYSQVAVDS